MFMSNHERLVLSTYKQTYKYPCIVCNNCICQVDDNHREHYACLSSRGMHISKSQMAKLYNELKYVPHTFNETEIAFFNQCKTTPLSSCSGHSGYGL
jgi:hypothetical protein